MNVKLLFKMVFLIIVLLLLVLMGLHNREWVNFRLPPLLNEKVSLQAAIMYFQSHHRALQQVRRYALPCGFYLR